MAAVKKPWTKHDKKTNSTQTNPIRQKRRLHQRHLPTQRSKLDKPSSKRNIPQSNPRKPSNPKDFANIIKVTTNKRDKAMVYVLFEATLGQVNS